MKNTPLSLLAFLALGISCHAEVVIEWKFDGGKSLNGGELATADAVAPGASATARLLPGSSIAAESTGISAKWSDFLRSGFLRSGRGTGKDEFGLKTEAASAAANNANYLDYFTFSGLGSEERATGGTLYMVFRPDAAWSNPVKRRALFGTGHTFEGVVNLQINEQKELSLTVGRVRPEATKDAVSATLAPTWEQGAWYFVGASWRQNAAPVLFVRKLSPEGAKASPAGLIGKASGVAPTRTDSPKKDPLVIGASWINPGRNAGTVDGADADIAYVRLENTHATQEDMEKAFESLAKN
ncbi:MAG TPA: hypothetical protein VIO38_01445 [Rariglobus sp.]